MQFAIKCNFYYLRLRKKKKFVLNPEINRKLPIVIVKQRKDTQQASTSHKAIEYSVVDTMQYFNAR